MKKRTRSISFRLAEDVLQLLKERAESVNLSPGEMARSLVISALCGSPSDEQVLKLESLEGGQRELLLHLGRTDKKLAYLLYVVLTQVANIDHKEAQAIVKQEFLRRLEDHV